jgi:predicted peptidase
MSKKVKNIIFIIIAIIVVAILVGLGATFVYKATNKEESQNIIDNRNEKTNGEFKNGNRGGGNTGNMQSKTTSKSEELQAMIDEVESKFTQLEYKDTETGITLAYNLFVPDNYDSSKSYPLVLFITDSSVVGQETKAALEQGYGGIIWATADEQAKHECFVLVPEYSTTIANDNSEVTKDVNATVNLLNSLITEYSVDTNRLYTTGQSMGGMTSIYLLKTYPELFAGALLASCQWDTEGLEVLKDQNIFYIVAEGDAKASPGQDEIKEKLENNGATVSTATWDATWTNEQFDTAVSSILSENNNLNFVKFATGTVLTANPISNMEHMASFDCVYKIEGVRDWLFEQSK